MAQFYASLCSIVHLNKVFDSDHGLQVALIIFPLFYSLGLRFRIRKNIEESFPTKSARVIPATVGTAGIIGLPFFIPSLASICWQVNRLCHPNSYILSAIFCFSSRGKMLLKRASGTSSSVTYQICLLERASSPALDITGLTSLYSIIA